MDELSGQLNVEPERGIPLGLYFQTMWDYRRTIAVAVAAVTVVFTIVALFVYLTAPVEREAAIQFRLTFDGAAEGRYPNGPEFSADEIIGNLVLTSVYNTNDLQRFGSFTDFKGSLTILQSNPSMDLLDLEYRAKLSDPKLTPVDRSRLEQEFRTKRESLRDPIFTITMRRHERVRRMPSDLSQKVLTDILSTWAKEADERKGATRYNIPVLSKNILRQEVLEDKDDLIAVDLLRVVAARVIDVLDRLSTLPGAQAFRTGKEQISLSEIHVQVEDAVRFEIQPLLGDIRRLAVSMNTEPLVRYAENQLSQVTRNLDASAARIKSLQAALGAYTSQRQPQDLRAAQAGKDAQQPFDSQTLIPQFGESFLNRLMELSAQAQNSDVQFRQSLTREIIEEGTRLIDLQREAAYYKDIVESVRVARSAGRASAEDSAQLKNRSKKAYDEIAQTLDRVMTIYQQLSAFNLNPSSRLFVVTTPYTEYSQRSISLSSLGLHFLLVLLVTLLLTPIACLAHRVFLSSGAPRTPPSAKGVA